MDKYELQEVDNLKKVLSDYDLTGGTVKHGIWEIHNGDDRWWELCRNGIPIVGCMASGEYEDGVEIGNLERLSDISYKERDDIFGIIVGKYSHTRTSPNEAYSPEEIISNEPELVNELVESGDWHINETFELFQKASAPFNDNQLLYSCDLGSVRFGNNSFELHIADHNLDDVERPSVNIRIFQQVPLFKFDMNKFEDQVKEKKFNIIDEKKVIYPGDLTKALYYNHGNMLSFDIKDNELANLDTFKLAVCKELLSEELVNAYWVEYYEQMKNDKTGYFQQLDRELEEYPSKVAAQKKMSILDVDILRKYYTNDVDMPWAGKPDQKWEAENIIKHMVISGFDDMQIDKLVQRINNYAAVANQPQKHIDSELYTVSALKKLRKSPEIKKLIKNQKQQDIGR
ncbi:hypothetical protein NZ47_03150 [Anaerovibrio lipolyticus]|uniref:Uncharacterized protein n=1 Tax=Anaerovibrio lipolyticus TaxID=82374 RepID=A0A0B2K1R5_9FIRM|nr:hypothetical protein [Anaerovibrio lipolyticus]KHM52716.1 hypothetical protein NZ47_03150 [Anaerovibrio lipolyticus]